MSFVTRRLASASVTLTSPRLAGGARSVSRDTGTSPTAGSASVMVTRTLVTPRQGSASTAGTPPWESSVTSARSGTLYWYFVYGIWYLVLGIWYLVFGIWYLVLGTWYLVLGTWYLVFGAWYLLGT